MYWNFLVHTSALKEGETMSSSIPKDIFHDIFLRLPGKTILACKCVCKNWFSIISSSDFVKIHHILIIQTSKPLILLKGRDSWRKNLFSIGYDSYESLLSKLLWSETDRFVEYAGESEISYPFKSLDYDFQLMGCCNGLVCLWFFDRQFFCLWNPATREYKELPQLDFIYNVDMVAFCYDYNSDDYKLLAGEFNFEFSSIEVFSLKSNSWRTIENVPYHFYISKRSGVLVNGELHWLTHRKNSPDVTLVCLDISNEIFKEMELPNETLDEIEQRKKQHWDCGLKFRNLGVVEGCLCLIVVDVEVRIDVWVMQNYGVGESWTKRYIVNNERITNDCTFRLMWCFKSGEILFGGVSTGLLLYFVNDDKVLNPDIYSLTKLCEEESYFESLVSLKSGTYVGEEKQIEESRVVSQISSSCSSDTEEQPASDFSVSPTMAESLILRGTLVGHDDMVTAIACPIDNANMMVSSSRDKSIIVWSLKKQEDNYGDPKLRLTGHTHFVQDVVLSSDAQFALSASCDGEVRLWDLITGDTARRFVGHTKDVLSLALSKDRQIVSASRDCSIKLWNALGECMCTLQDVDSHDNWVSCVGFIPGKPFQAIVSASWDKTVKVWNMNTCKLRNTLIGHSGYVNTVAVSPDGRFCVSGDEDGVILFWDLEAEGEKLFSLNAGGVIHALCFCPNRYWICAATEEGVNIWDCMSKNFVQDLKPEEPESGYCSSMNWSSDGSTLFTGYTDGVIRVWGF